MHTVELLTELQNAENSSVFSRKSDSNTDSVPAILNNLGTLTEKFAVESVFRIVVGDRFEQLKLLKRTLLKSFFWGFSENFWNKQFL